MSFSYSLQAIADIETGDYSFTLSASCMELIKHIETNLLSKRIKSQPQWEILRTTKQPVDIVPVKISNEDIVRSTMNKLSDQTFLENVDILLKLLRSSPADLHDIIFDISCTNRFLSKLYADLYATIFTEIPEIKPLFTLKINSAMAAFIDFHENIEEEWDYDEICKRNEENENKRSMAQFLIHLRDNGIFKEDNIVNITRSLLESIIAFSSKPNFEQSIDVAVELFAIFYNKKLMEKETLAVDGKKVNFMKTLGRIAKTPRSGFTSMSSRSLFKFMDLVGL